MPTQLKRILCVDDERDILHVQKVALEFLGGYEVHVCNSGKQALPYARHIQPDLILLDVMMPEMDGYATLKAFQDDQALRDIPVIFVTASGTSKDIDDSNRSSVAGMLAKPFDPMHLPQQIHALWSKYHGL